MGCLGINFVKMHLSRVEKQYRQLGLKSKMIELDDGTIVHCWVPDEAIHKGKPSLMLVQGFAANGCMGWEKQVPDLAPKFALYVPDLIFFGNSTTSSSQRSEIFQAECMIKALDEEKVKEVLVVGTSYGGFVAFWMAQLSPGLVKKVVIASSGVCMTPTTNDSLMKDFNASHVHEILMPASVKVQKKALYRCFYKPNYMPDFIVQDLMDEFGHNREERIQLLDGLVIGSPNAPPLPTLSQEVLILWGEHDRLFDVDLGYQLQKHLGSKSKLVVIPNAGHVPQVERPKEFNTAIQIFLKI